MAVLDLCGCSLSLGVCCANSKIAYSTFYYNSRMKLTTANEMAQTSSCSVLGGMVTCGVA